MTLRTLLAATVLTFASASTAVAGELPGPEASLKLKVEKPMKGMLKKSGKIKAKPVRQAIK